MLFNCNQSSKYLSVSLLSLGIIISLRFTQESLELQRLLRYQVSRVLIVARLERSVKTFGTFICMQAPEPLGASIALPSYPAIR